MGSKSQGRIRIIPKHKPEPDLDQVVLALLAMLDEQQQAEPVTEQDTPDGAAS